MLFLLNTTLVAVAVPEMHLRQRWRHMGCGNPDELRAQDAIGFVVSQLLTQDDITGRIEPELAKDLAALIIAKTGANSLILRPTAGGGLEPYLRDLPNMVLDTYERGSANDADTSALRRQNA